MTTFKFYLHARSPQDIIDLFMLGAGAPLDRNTSRLTHLRVPGETVVEALFSNADAANALEDYISENEFSLPGIRVLDMDEFKALQREANARATTVHQATAPAASRVTIAKTISTDPESFSGCGDPTYRIGRSPKRPDAE